MDPNMQFQLDPTYWLCLGPALLFMMFAQWRVKSTYEKWGGVPSQNGLNGAQVAQQLLAQGGMGNVQVGAVQGSLTDHYNPMTNQLALSEVTINKQSVGSMAVVAHEVGHAQQDATNSLLMRARTGIVPIVNLGSQLGPILFITGLVSQFPILMWGGIILFSTAFLFALLTLPVELDASRRALAMLETTGLVTNEEERRGASEVLRAAALTYVAGMMTALFQLLYYVSLALRGQRGGTVRRKY